MKVTRIEVSSSGGIKCEWKALIIRERASNTIMDAIRNSDDGQYVFWLDKWTSIVDWMMFFLISMNEWETKETEELFKWFDNNLEIIKKLPQIQDYIDMILLWSKTPNSIEQTVERFTSLKNFLEYHFKNEISTQD